MSDISDYLDAVREHDDLDDYDLLDFGFDYPEPYASYDDFSDPRKEAACLICGVTIFIVGHENEDEEIRMCDQHRPWQDEYFAYLAKAREADYAAVEAELASIGDAYPHCTLCSPRSVWCICRTQRDDESSQFDWLEKVTEGSPDTAALMSTTISRRYGRPSHSFS